jgi:hypothetical protein
MQKKLLVVGAVILGIILLAVSAVYFTTPVNHLPHFFLGYDPSVTRIHFKHAIGTLLLGLAAFAFAWFQSGKKSSKKEQ